LDCDPMGWNGWLRHQHRVAVTYRHCNPAGVLGMGITFGMLWSLPLIGSGPGFALFAITAGVRIGTAWVNRRLIDRAAGDPGARRGEGGLFWPAAFLAGLAEGMFWLVAWLP